MAFFTAFSPAVVTLVPGGYGNEKSTFTLVAPAGDWRLSDGANFYTSVPARSSAPHFCLGSPATSETVDLIATASSTASRASENSGDVADFESFTSDVQPTVKRKFCDTRSTAFDNCRSIEDSKERDNSQPLHERWSSKLVKNLLFQDV